MARPKTTEPTNRHLEILRVIIKLAQGNAPPVISDIARELRGANVSSVSNVLKVMERMELIETKSNGRGKIVLATQSGRAAVGIRGIPLVGTIPAGILSEVLDTAQDFVELTDLIPYRQGDFLLQVEGESMIGAGILPGDMVLLRPDVEPRQGDITAVLVGEERKATLKRVFIDRDKEEVRLQAANPAFHDQIVSNEEVRFAGVFQSLVRFRSGMWMETQ